MANRQNKFLIKRSNVAGKIPTAGDLLLGEMALNTADVILYTSGTTADTILPIGWDRINRSGDTVEGDLIITGSTQSGTISANTISATTYYGDASNLTNVGLKTKSGIENASGFTGNPKIKAIVFTTPFSSNNYSVTITGEDNRNWTVQSKSSTGFTIDSNTNPLFTGNVFWQAIEVGESN